MRQHRILKKTWQKLRRKKKINNHGEDKSKKKSYLTFMYYSILYLFTKHLLSTLYVPGAGDARVNGEWYSCFRDTDVSQQFGFILQRFMDLSSALVPRDPNSSSLPYSFPRKTKSRRKMLSHDSESNPKYPRVSNTDLPPASSYSSPQQFSL